MSDEAAGTISAEKLERLTGLTDRRHRQLAKDGYFPEPERGQYQLVVTLRGLFKYFREDRNKATMTLTGERLRKLKEEADRIALENATLRGELVDKADFLKRLEPIYTAIRQKIMNCSMSDHQKDSLLGELSKLHEV
jgi:phage terminase Nu1 subunit (DNA packaging protein)